MSPSSAKVLSLSCTMFHNNAVYLDVFNRKFLSDIIDSLKFDTDFGIRPTMDRISFFATQMFFSALTCHSDGKADFGRFFDQLRQ